ncbi:hypothetical protein IQ238_24365 [Pleurocapsales cyanobacterium LEGE 06147]|nr:hypothetical protein [Pleurocapsales cyanobacterium LEGE 06147]
MFAECSGISRNTLRLWLKRRETTGLTGAIRNYPYGSQPKIADLETFHRFVQEHGHLTQQGDCQLN